MKNVLSKINWPSLKDAVKLSLIAIAVSLSVGIFCYVIDTGVIGLEKLLIK